MLLAQDICSSKSIANIVVKIVVVGTTYCASAVVFPVFSQHMKLPKKRVHNRGSQIPLFFLLNPAIPPLFTPGSRSRPIFFLRDFRHFLLDHWHRRYDLPSDNHQRTGRGKNSIIRAKLMYRSGKDTVRWDTCCSERQLTTDGKRPLSYHSLLHMYWQSRQWTSIKVWGQWPGGFVRIGWNRIQPFSKHQQHPNCMKFLWRG